MLSATGGVSPYTYSLILSGSYPDNNDFNINGNDLRVNTSKDYETRNIYTIKIQAMTSEGGVYQKTFTITINDVNEPPTALKLNGNPSSDPVSIDENQAPGTSLGTLDAEDPEGGPFTFTLAPDDETNDNDQFSIAGTSLETAASFNYEIKTTYTVKVIVQDEGTLEYDANITVNINDVSEYVVPFIIPNPNSVLSSSSALIGWTSIEGAYWYKLEVGTSADNRNEIFTSPQENKTSHYVKNIPVNGETIYARLTTDDVAPELHVKEFQYTAVSGEYFEYPEVCGPMENMKVEGKVKITVDNDGEIEIGAKNTDGAWFKSNITDKPITFYTTDVDGLHEAARFQKGRLGIGLSSEPTSRLDVNGTITTTGFKLPTNPLNGGVLTSDANGNATWQSLSTSVGWSILDGKIFTYNPNNTVYLGPPMPTIENVKLNIQGGDLRITNDGVGDIKIGADENGAYLTASEQEKPMIFYNTGTDGPLEAMRIKNGNLGIGCLDPQKEIQIGELPEGLTREDPVIDTSGVVYRDADSIEAPVAPPCPPGGCEEGSVAKIDEKSLLFETIRKFDENKTEKQYSFLDNASQELTLYKSYLFDPMEAVVDVASINPEKFTIQNATYKFPNYSHYISEISPGEIGLIRGWGDWLKLKHHGNDGYWHVHNPKDQDRLEFGYKIEGQPEDQESSHRWGIMCLHNGGNVSIGKTSAEAKLDVEGNIKSSGSVMATNFKIGEWTIEAPDYVFDAEKYDLKSLDEVRKFIDKEKRLPGVPSASEMKREGVDLAEMSMTLLKKIEEMQLYILQQQEKIEKLEKGMEELKR